MTNQFTFTPIDKFMAKPTYIENVKFSNKSTPKSNYF